jgi:uncharacterized protein YjbI with pentapeptide repeats
VLDRFFDLLFQRGCKKFVKRYGNEIDIDLTDIGVAEVKLSKHPIEFAKATDLVVNLDNFQYLLCMEIRRMKGEDVGLKRRLKLIRYQIILAISQLENISTAIKHEEQLESNAQLQSELNEWIRYMSELYRVNIDSLYKRRTTNERKKSDQRMELIRRYQGIDMDELQKEINKSEPDFRQLLLDGKVREFNDLRERYGCSSINLDKIDLHNMIVEGVDLSSANLRGANLKNTNLEEADLSNAILTGADLSGANLRKAIIWHTNLSNSKLDGIDLEDAMIIDTTFDRAQGTNLGTSLAKAIAAQNRLSDIELADLTFPYFYINPLNPISVFRYKDLFNLLDDRLQLAHPMDAIRYIGICDINKREFIYSIHNKNTTPILTHKEKNILLKMSCRSWKFRRQLESSVGLCKYAAEKYEKIKRLSIPLDDDNLLFITTDILCDLNPLIHDIFQVSPKNEDKIKITNNNDNNNKSKPSLSDFSSLPKTTNLCKQIVNKDTQIRAAFQCKNSGEIIDYDIRQNIVPLLSPGQLSESFRLTAKKWQLRRTRFSNKIGSPIYTMAKFEKVIRITIQANKETLLFIATEPTSSPDNIVKTITGL